MKMDSEAEQGHGSDNHDGSASDQLSLEQAHAAAGKDENCTGNVRHKDAPDSASPAKVTHRTSFIIPASVTGSLKSDSSADNDAANEQLLQAFDMLRKAVQPYLPLDRDPGTHEMGGIDMVNHQHQDRPFNELGVVAFAAHLIHQWEQHIGSDYKAKIGEPRLTNHRYLDA